MPKTTIQETAAKIDKHEAVCAVRYEQIDNRLRRLEAILLSCAGAIISLLIYIEFMR